MRSNPQARGENISHIGSDIDQQIHEQVKKARFFTPSLLVEWDFRQNERLDYVFGFFGLFVQIDQLATRINQSRGDEDDQVPVDVLLGVRVKERPIEPCVQIALAYLAGFS